MTNKEYLGQAYRIDQRINSKIEQVSSLRELATKATATISDEKIRKSLHTYGYVDPVIWNEVTGNIVGGHQRFKVLTAEGATEIDCVVVHIEDPQDEKALNIALNKAVGEWEPVALAELLQDLQSSGYEMDCTGFDAAEIDDLFSKVHDKDVKDDDCDIDPDEIKPFVQAGDVWLLGRHRMVCGDSIKPEDVALLMDGVKANLVVTDPPYNVAYQSADGKSIQNDSMADEQFYAFLLAAFRNMATHMAEGGSAYIFHELCRENHDCVMVSSIFAGALYFVEEDGSIRNLMRDASHYVPEGYLRAGMEAGVNAGIYNNSNKMVKPILLEYHTLKTDETTVYERPVDKFIYDPCRVDFNFMSRYATNVATTAIALTAASTEVEIGKTLQLTCGFTPVNATDRDIVYTSSNTSLATVDGNGLVTGIALGDVMITATLVSDPSITATITLEVVEAAAEDEGGSGDSGDTTDENVVFDFDFTTNNLDDYALSNIFTVPDGSDVSSISYHATYGMTLNGQLPNGLNLVEPIDASKPWTLEITALFVTPTVLAGNRRAFLGGANLYPFVFINGTTYDNMGFQISNGTHATKYGILAYDAEATYKIVYNGSGSAEIFVNGSSKGTVSVNFTGGQFTVILGNVPGKSSAYVWQNVENTNSYLHKLKFTYN